uniref:Centromere protein X n=1 Tax=Anolis carolinensis TaxID=28377 RepID=A0A803TSZ9_ANOCA
TNLNSGSTLWSLCGSSLLVGYVYDALSCALNSLEPCVTEAAARGARQAETEDLTKVEVEHVEKVLPQLLLDF